MLDPNEWIEFYESYVECDQVSRVVARCLELGEKDPEYNARRIMLQCKRMIEISRAQDDVTINSDALKLLFLMILAENASKLFYDFADDGRSREYVRRFFEELTTKDQRDYLNRSLVKGIAPQGVRFVVDFLYSVRCDVAHEGLYYYFHFKTDMPLVVQAGDELASNRIEYEDIVKLIVNVCYQATKSKAGI